MSNSKKVVKGMYSRWKTPNAYGETEEGYFRTIREETDRLKKFAKSIRTGDKFLVPFEILGVDSDILPLPYEEIQLTVRGIYPHVVLLTGDKGKKFSLDYFYLWKYCIALQDHI